VKGEKLGPDPSIATRDVIRRRKHAERAGRGGCRGKQTVTGKRLEWRKAAGRKPINLKAGNPLFVKS